MDILKIQLFLSLAAVANFFKKYEPPISSQHSMSQPCALRGLQEESQFERILEKEVEYEHKVNNFDAYPTNGPERSPAKKSGNLSISQFAKLKKRLFDAWAP